ncbi:hypothetical protein [Oceanobacillus neutriphilus]|nr:hypothetical protein [Oceanobacillus neutriphilus]
MNKIKGISVSHISSDAEILFSCQFTYFKNGAAISLSSNTVNLIRM